MKHLSILPYLYGLLLCTWVSCTPDIIEEPTNNENTDTTNNENTDTTTSYNYQLDSTYYYTLVDSQWVLNNKYEYTYSDDKQTELISYDWKDEQWVPNRKYEFSYSGDKQTEQITYYWKDKQWVPDWKYEFSYSGDKQTEWISYDWKDEQWVPCQKNEYTYSGDKKTESISYYGKDEQWVLYWKCEYTYSGDKMTELISYDWQDEQWVPNSKSEYTYNSHGAQESYIFYIVQDGNFMIFRSVYSEYEYIPNTDYVKNQISTSYYYDRLTGAFVGAVTSRYDNYWSISEVKGMPRKMETPMRRMDIPQADMPLMPETDTYSAIDEFNNAQRDMPFIPVNNAHR